MVLVLIHYFSVSFRNFDQNEEFEVVNDFWITYSSISNWNISKFLINNYTNRRKWEIALTRSPTTDTDFPHHRIAHFKGWIQQCMQEVDNIEEQTNIFVNESPYYHALQTRTVGVTYIHIITAYVMCPGRTIFSDSPSFSSFRLINDISYNRVARKEEDTG